ncbi:MAG: hypothetical protein ACOX1X_09420 [Dethiobacteria bacterium]
MITSPLLEKTRRINKILQKTAGQRVDFTEVSEVLKNVIHANVYIADREGKILGYALVDEFECDIMVSQVLKKSEFPERYNDFLLRDDETRVKLKTKKKCLCFRRGRKLSFYKQVNHCLSRLWVEARDWARYCWARFAEALEAEDLILAEIGATVVGMEILRSRAEKN